MGFFGVWGEDREARARVDTRAAYLYAPVLHFSLDGRIALCDGTRADTLSPRIYPHLFLAAATHSSVAVTPDTLASLYRKYGKALRPHLSLPTAFVLYDSKKGRLLLGGTHGEKCFIEAQGNSILFSSAPHLLRHPVPVDFACIDM